MNVFYHVLAFCIHTIQHKASQGGEGRSESKDKTCPSAWGPPCCSKGFMHTIFCFFFELSWDFRKLWQECHTRSWQIVSDFLKQNLTLFVGKTSDGESTILPQSRAWLKDMSIEVGNSHDDHQIVLLLNCPSIGVLSAARLSFILTYISNILSDFPLNSVCFLIHPNRAGHQDGRQGYLCVTK